MRAVVISIGFLLQGFEGSGLKPALRIFFVRWQVGA